jgi:hypothetical protein
MSEFNCAALGFVVLRSEKVVEVYEGDFSRFAIPRRLPTFRRSTRKKELVCFLTTFISISLSLRGGFSDRGKSRLSFVPPPPTPAAAGEKREVSFLVP